MVFNCVFSSKVQFFIFLSLEIIEWVCLKLLLFSKSIISFSFLLSSWLSGCPLRLSFLLRSLYPYLLFWRKSHVSHPPFQRSDCPRFRISHSHSQAPWLCEIQEWGRQRREAYPVCFRSFGHIETTSFRRLCHSPFICPAVCCLPICPSLLGLYIGSRIFRR